ncbi:MAG: hypothetical protein L5655_04345 [Thermosediminibacteraceae bacterium]|nr:hypothetical protein [Thermosediminibacteraceae bacterium]
MGRYSVCRKVLFVLIMMVLIIMVSGCDSSEFNEAQKTSENKTIKNNNFVEEDTTINNKLEEESESKPGQQELSYEEWLRNIIIETVGDKTNYGKPRIESIIFLDENKTDMEITLWADDNLTAGLIRNGAIIKSSEILRKIYSDDRAKNVLIYWLFPVKDVYGNEQMLPIIQIQLTRETANKINWQGFNPLDLEKVADIFHVHPDLQ